MNFTTYLKRERSGSPPDRRRWCREPPAAVCGAGTAAAAARAPVDGLKRENVEGICLLEIFNFSALEDCLKSEIWNLTVELEVKTIT